MRKTVLVLIVSAMPLLGCPSRHILTIPDPTIPHRVAEEARVKVWVRSADGTLTVQEIEVDAGWYVASPQIVGP